MSSAIVSRRGGGAVETMSLDEIIGKRRPKIGKPQQRGQQQSKTTGVVGDARNRIIARKRTRIGDARDQLARLARQRGDARAKLQQLRARRRPPAPFADATREVTQTTSPRRMQIQMASARPRPVMPIVRSVDNDFFALKGKKIVSDGRGLGLKIVAENDFGRRLSPGAGLTVPRLARREEPIYLSDDNAMDTSPPISILKKRPIGLGRMRSDSERPPLRHASPPSLPPPRQTPEFRIVVSNLKNTVTGADIQELFGDIGELAESRLVRPGTAEVIYSSLKDAQKAVDAYHNRQLDGQPMKCFLVNPRNPLPKLKDSSDGRLGKPSLPPSSNSSVEPDISTFHKVLFRKY